MGVIVPIADIDPAGPVIKAGNRLIPIAQIRHVDVTDIDQDCVEIVLVDGGTAIAHGFDAVEVIFQLKPSALEGRRLRWKKGAWRFHNWVGHPLMDLLAMLGFKKQAIRWHDYTTPRPR